jgi:zinc/manganese transport system permease protein
MFYEFMQNALGASLLFCISAIPLGLLLQLRRLSLMGEALSHGMLPGIALSYVFSGFSIPFLLLGGGLSGLFVLFLSQKLSQKSGLNEDATLSVFYLLFLALGVGIVSLYVKGTCNLTHLLFGNILAINRMSLLWTFFVSSASLVVFCVFHRYFIYECFDRDFSKQIGIPVDRIYKLFLVLVSINLVMACQTMGTLMALGMMTIPGLCGRMLGRTFFQIWSIATIIGILSCIIGLFFSYYANLPSGPAMVLCCGFFLLCSFVIKNICKKHIQPVDNL